MASRLESNLQLESNFIDTFMFVAAAVICMMGGLVLSFAGYKVGWLIGTVPSIFFVYVITQRLSNYSTLLLSPGGFTFKSQRRAFSFRWSDIERFWVDGNFVSPVIRFSLTPSVYAQRNDPQYRLQSAYLEEGMTYFEESYGIGSKQLCSMMNEWRIRYTDRANRVVVFG